MGMIINKTPKLTPRNAVTFAHLLAQNNLSAAKKQSSQFQSWGFQNYEPFVIAGPCSAESEMQMLETARQLKDIGQVSAMRAGVWKPRTRPGAFEGVGKTALQWLMTARQETGIPVITEVGNAAHVEEVLKHEIDMIWIGARTTVNPFYVQEIADALQGVDIPVFVKNPIHPELGLWIGAIERLERAGISKVAAIHRGFFTSQPVPFRNAPKWEMSFELRTRLPELPIICDPSHIAGNRDLIKQVSQTALDLNLDGLIIETHPNPDEALSDAAQQITPAALHNILTNLVIRHEKVEEETVQGKLDEHREVIDALDHDIIQKLKQRFAHIEEIGQIKAEDKITIFQLNRWYDMVNARKKYGQLHGLDEDFLHELFSLIHKYSVRQQTKLGQKK